MESSAEKLEGEPKLSRSLSIHQLYEDKPGISNGISLLENVDSLKHKHKRIGVKDRTDLEQARRQSRKLFPFSRLQTAIKKSRRDRALSKQKKVVLNCDAKKKPHHNHIDPNNRPHDSKDSSNSTLGNRIVSSCKDNKNENAESAENVQHRACLGNHFVVPKRPRGASRRKKTDNSFVPNGTASGVSDSSHKSITNAQNSMLSGDSVTTSPASSIKFKKTLSEHNVNSLDSGKISHGDDGHITTHEVVTDKATEVKVVRNPRKRRYTSEKNACLENAGLLFQKAESVGDLREYNLEENAARMLSSRFDPSCTGFSGSRVPQNVANDCSVHSQSFSADSDVLGSKDSSGCDANRTLRPRRRNYNNSARKRRHFYEVQAANMDPHWVVKRDIRILWPLDQIWYSGIVKDYNPDTGQHHIKYEDRDEEWVDLQKERFKLLMFPSEFSGKLDFSECDNDVKRKKEKAREHECGGSSLNESETITSWLNRSIRRVNPSPLNILKEKRISHSNKHSTSALDDVKDSRASCSSGINKTSGCASIVSRGVCEDYNQKAVQEAVDRRFSFFYYRRRFGKRMKRSSDSFKDHANRDSIFLFQSQGPLVFDVVLNALKLNQGKPELMLLLPWNLKLIVSYESFWLLNTFMGFHFGKLMHIWPEIYLDVFFLDNLTGLKIVSYKGCIRNVVALLCLICRTFQKSNCCRKRGGDRQPFTSIGFKFSGSQVIGRHLLYMAHYYYKLGGSRWDSLLKTFKKQCILRREVPTSECTCPSTKSVLERSEMPLPEDAESTFLLGHHLKLLMKNEISFYRLMNQNVPSLESTQENHGKLTNGGCFHVDDSSCLEDISSPERSDEGSHTCMDTGTCQKQKLVQVEAQLPDTDVRATGTTDITLDIINSSSLRSRGEHYGHNPALSSFGYHPHVWPDDFGFVNGYRKPRTRVSYSSPFGGYRSGKLSQGHRKNGPSYKKSRTDSAKMLVAVSRNFQRNLSSLICEANVLIVEGDKGWREHAAMVLLDSDDHDWKILIKLSGITKYSHKAHQFLQPGTTNRYTHAMMWKGGKNWTLEFTNRGQWALFKEIHEECYNRNIRAASVKNIPIPGVRPIEDNNDCCFDSVPFTRSFSKYFRQIGTEVDLAMDPSHVIYDMDSDDEEWVLKQSSLDDDGNKVLEFSDNLFEKAMDMLEKFAYAEQRDDFSDAEIESFMEEIGSPETIKSIYKYWLSKRQKKGVPLVRQFQPPLWEQYQKQLKEWELAVSTLSNTSNCQGKISSIEKPPMFAFCLKPRGLEAPNKGSKQRSHKKFTVSGQHSIFGREYDNLQPAGRKLSGFLIGDDKHSVTVHNHDSEDSSLWLQSPTGFSPRDSVDTGVASTTNDGLEKIHHIKFQRGNSKRARVFSSNRDFHMSSTSYNQKHMRIGFSQWNSGSREWSNARQIQPNGFQKHHPDNEEFRLHDASSAAQHATKMAMLKKEKAQWLFHKADLALHRATVALMSAEAMKASEGDMAEEN